MEDQWLLNEEALLSRQALSFGEGSLKISFFWKYKMRSIVAYKIAIENSDKTKLRRRETPSQMEFLYSQYDIHILSCPYLI